MALLVVTGLPCSGRTTRALEIQAYFESQLAQTPSLTSVVCITDDNVHVDRSVYECTYCMANPSATYRRPSSCSLPKCCAPCAES